MLVILTILMLATTLAVLNPYYNRILADAVYQSDGGLKGTTGTFPFKVLRALALGLIVVSLSIHWYMADVPVTLNLFGYAVSKFSAICMASAISAAITLFTLLVCTRKTVESGYREHSIEIVMFGFILLLLSATV